MLAWLLRHLLLLRVELVGHLLLLLWESLEGIVLLLLRHAHASWVGHEGVRLVCCLHVSEGILAHVLLLLQHHSRLKLLLHVGGHHLHHLVLLLHVHLRLLLFVAHWVWDEGCFRWVGRLGLLLGQVHVASVHHRKGIPSSGKVILLLIRLLLSRSLFKVENINALGRFRSRSSTRWAT